MVMGDIFGIFVYFLTSKRLESEFKQGGRGIFSSFSFLGYDDVRLMSVCLEILETVFPFFYFLCISRDKSPLFLLYHFFCSERQREEGCDLLISLLVLFPMVVLIIPHTLLSLGLLPVLVGRLLIDLSFV